MSVDQIPELMTTMAADVDNFLAASPSNATTLLYDAVLEQIGDDWASFVDAMRRRLADHVLGNIDAELNANDGVWAA